MNEIILLMHYAKKDDEVRHRLLNKQTRERKFRLTAPALACILNLLQRVSYKTFAVMFLTERCTGVEKLPFRDWITFVADLVKKNFESRIDFDLDITVKRLAVLTTLGDEKRHHAKIVCDFVDGFKTESEREGVLSLFYCNSVAPQLLFEQLDRWFKDKTRKYGALLHLRKETKTEEGWQQFLDDKKQKDTPVAPPPIEFAPPPYQPRPAAPLLPSPPPLPPPSSPVHLPPAPQTKQTTYDACICVICLVSPREIMLEPCNHFSFCAQCAKNYGDFTKKHQCPVCNQTINGVKRVFGF